MSIGKNRCRMNTLVSTVGGVGIGQCKEASSVDRP